MLDNERETQLTSTDVEDLRRVHGAIKRRAADLSPEYCLRRLAELRKRFPSVNEALFKGLEDECYEWILASNFNKDGDLV